MPQGLYIDARQLAKGAKAFEQLTKLFPDKVSDVLNANVDAIDRAAKRNAPVGVHAFLKENISPNKDKLLEKHITSRAPYSAYIEFGTGRYAAQYVGSLPSDYQTFAAQFRTGKRAFPPLNLIKEWILKKGIVASFNVKTRRRVGTGKSKSEQQRAEQMAFVIARAIFINGVHPHPFMIPALINQQPKIIRDMVNLLNRMKIV